MFTLTQTQFLSGVWKGRLAGTSGAQAPALVVARPDGTRLDAPKITTAPGAVGNWDVEVELPREALSDGTHIYLVTLPETDTVLHRITIIAGTPAGEDIRAEVAALRAELDQLRAAFRTEFRSRQSS